MTSDRNTTFPFNLLGRDDTTLLIPSQQGGEHDLKRDGDAAYDYNQKAYGCDDEDGFGLAWEEEYDEHCRFIPHRHDKEAESEVEERAVQPQARELSKRRDHTGEYAIHHDDGYGYEYKPDSEGVYHRFSLA